MVCTTYSLPLLLTPYAAGLSSPFCVQHLWHRASDDHGLKVIQIEPLPFCQTSTDFELVSL
jgi:hypothetical protein